MTLSCVLPRSTNIRFNAKAINPETEALLRWKSTLIGANPLPSWSIANSTCSWSGITCDAAGHVTKLHLSGFGIHATILSVPSP
uniref:Leucine-rich repeat-containing N-terminal plant-type domain-containing protein n=1 Tax=Triticum urartu TaxID=4572 RepID=A0A8R7UV22_TRIUA